MSRLFGTATSILLATCACRHRTRRRSAVGSGLRNADARRRVPRGVDHRRARQRAADLR